MNKYDKYLGRMIKELESKRAEIDRSERPEQQLDRMRQYYSKAERLDNYFKNYRDKGSGGENYRNFLKAKGKYNLRYGPYEKEAKVVASFEKTLANPPKKGKGNWDRNDWAVYDAVKTWRINYTWEGWRKGRW